MTTVGDVVGRRVRRLREDKGWSQRDLAGHLNGMGLPSWTRAGVSLLETDGQRGDRLLDLAALCWVFGVRLEDLLDGDEEIDLSNGERIPLGRVRNALAGQVRPEVRREGWPSPLAEDPEEVARVARRAGLTVDELHLVTAALWGNHDGQFLRARDALAGLDADTPQRTAQARRGHATRAMLNELAVVRDAGDLPSTLDRGRDALEQLQNRQVDYLNALRAPSGQSA